MAYQVLARKYRPQRFSEVIGQEHVTRTLKNAIEQQRIAHGYIFSGHRGIGKTTVARILAMALNCRSADHPVPEPCGVCESCTEIRAGNSVDVIEIDAATNRGIDEIRELRDAARYRPARDRFKIWILDEAHQITDAAFNALLKTLEEPPGHVIFMLATTQPEDIPQTIRSRCQHFSFHAVCFDDILGQLRDLTERENIHAEPDALALLAEAGDGSMRDALSILDQAIACCGETLSADLVRQLVGTVPSATLEQMMQAVGQSSSEQVLRLTDKLISEGQNPTHFARQMSRFLRNVIVAKVAGSDSELLQISSDERQRVGRVAEAFSEEDLARYLQIMLRTHSELGYKQEQRFHLELGLLKMAHATRLLPLEQLLSEAGAGEMGSRAGGPRPAVAAAVPERPRSADPSFASRPGKLSPFNADSARKSGGSGSKLSAEETAPVAMGAGASVVMGAAAPAIAPENDDEESLPDSQSEPQAQGSTTDHLRGAVVSALENGGHRTLAYMLDAGEWSLQGNELTVKVAAAPAVLDMAFGAEAKKIANTAATGAAGRPLKVMLVGGGANSNSSKPRTAAPVGNGGSRNRALQDPVVQRMREKFGAEVRTIIDHKEKR
ncbi:MAG TPA: DNA polymerase III subunit gamma/tau [Terriglobales bacterium]|jgi:DNA polymerase-3 subunit gamma/tau|nr:DNA polymerase III subunit gamma/tau [Terriglobales bacterium]